MEILAQCVKSLFDFHRRRLAAVGEYHGSWNPSMTTTKKGSNSKSDWRSIVLTADKVIAASVTIGRAGSLG